MSKYEKFRKKQRDYEDEYYDGEYDNKKKHSRKREQKKVKYFDDYETYESNHKFDNRTQKFRY